MRVKTFRGESTKTVLDQIKTELGPEAVILGTKNFKENGACVCEIVAALEEEPRPAQVRGAAGRVSQTPPPGEPAALAGLPPGWSQWSQEWSLIKEHLTALMRPQLRLEELAPRQRLAVEYLEREGAKLEVVMELYRRLQGKPRESVLGPLEKMVRVRPWSASRWKGKHHALAGPSGVGKTSTLIRLALLAKKERPKTRILLVNLDVDRGAGRLTLRRMAELVGCGYTELQSPEELDDCLKLCQDFDKVFFDLPPLKLDERLDDYLGRMGLDRIENLGVLLALSPHYASRQLERFVEQHRSSKTAGLVWTKLDEACSFGAMVNAGFSTGLPVTALSFGAQLKDSLVPASCLHVWRLVFKRQLPDDASDE